MGLDTVSAFGAVALENLNGYGAPYQVLPAYYTAPYGLRLNPEQELDALKGQAEYFEDALEGIKKRIHEHIVQKYRIVTESA